MYAWSVNKHAVVAAFCIFAQSGKVAAKGEVGCSALNSHEITLLIMENHGKIMELCF